MARLITFVIGMALAFTAFAQPTFTILPTNVTANQGDVITIDVQVADFDEVISMQYSMNWNASVLEFVSVDNISSALPGLSTASFGTPPATDDGVVTASWFDNNVTGVSLSDGTVLYSLIFNVLSDDGTDIIFSGNPSVIEVTTAASNGQDVSLIPGNTTVNGGGPIDGGGCTDPTVNNVSTTAPACGVADGNITISLPGAISDYTYAWSGGISSTTNSASNLAPGTYSVTITNAGDVCNTVVTRTLVEDCSGGGDVTFQLDSYTNDAGNQICMPVSVSGFTDVVSFQYSIIWDENVLEYTGAQNFNLTDLNASSFGATNASTGSLTVSWFHQATTGVTVPNGTSIYEVCFDVIGTSGQNSLVTFSGQPTPIEVTDNNGNQINMIADNGAVTVSGIAPPADGVTFTAPTINAAGGDQVCLPVTVDGFTDVVSFQYTMNWNANVLEYTGVQNFNLTDLNASSFGDSNASSGDLTVSWFHQATTGVTVPNATVIFEICFDVVGSTGQNSGLAFSGNPTPIEVTDNNGSVITFNNSDGVVNVTSGDGGGGNPVDGIVFNAPNIDAAADENVCIDITVDNFTDIVSFQYSMNWNSNVLEYTGVQGFNLTDLNASSFGTNNIANGDLAVSWFHQATTGVTVPDGTVIFQICFDVIGDNGQTSSVDFSGNPTPIEVTDNNGSIVTFNGDDGIVTVGGVGCDTPTIASTDITPATCDTADGEADIDMEGPDADYTYVWSPNVGTANATGNARTDLPAGTYQVTITRTADACDLTTNVVVGDDCVVGTDLTFTLSDENVAQGEAVCFELSVDNFTDIVSFQYSINWDPNVLMFTGVQDFNLQDLNASSFGTNGTNNGNLAVSWFHQATTGVTVSNGTPIAQICFEVLGGSGQGAIDFSASPTIVEVTDNNGTIVPPTFDGGVVTIGGTGCDTPNIASTDITPASCDVADGEADIDMEGPDADYTYVWSPNVGTANATGNARTDLPAGTYQVTITRTADGCEVTTTITVGDDCVVGSGDLTFILSNETAAPGETVCFDLTINNFTDIVSFQYSINWNANVLMYTGVQGFNLQDLNASSFGDNSAASGNLGVSWFHQATTGVSVSSSTVIAQICFEVIGNNGQNGTIDFSANPTIVEVTDNTGTIVDPVFDGGTLSIEGGPPPTGLVFKAANDCVEPGEEVCFPVQVSNFDDMVSFQYSMNWDPTVLEYTGVQGFNLTDLNASSFGVINVANGNLGTSWFHQATTGVTISGECVTIYEVCFDVIGDVGDNTPLNFSDTPTIIEVTDNEGNVVTDLTFQDASIDLGNCASPCPAVTLTSSTVTDVNCSGEATGGVAVSVAGGDDTYDYEWVNTANNNVVSSSQNLTDVVAGSYELTATSCDGDESLTQIFTIADGSTLTLTGATEAVACLGDNNGSVTVEASNGDGNYDYVWSGGTITGTIPSSTVSGLGAGVYTVTVTDGNDCELIESLTVSAPNSTLEATATPTAITCNGQADGSINLSITGGWGTYNYDWSGGLSGNDPIDVAVGTYDLIITDNEGCEVVINNIEVEDAAAITISGDVINVDGSNNIQGEIDITVTGGAGTFTDYDWDGPANFDSNTADINGLTIAGEYCVTATDINDCEATMCFTVSSPLTIVLEGIVDACAGESTGSIDISIFGAEGAPTFSWTGGAMTEDISGLAAGMYDVTVNDATSGQTATMSFTVNEGSPILITETITTISNGGVCDGSITTDVEGGFGGYQYAWSGGETTPNIIGLCEGIYTLTVTDMNACTTTETYEISLELAATINVNNESCGGSCDGLIELNIASGSSPYTVDLFEDGNNTPIQTLLDADGILEFPGLCDGTYSVLITDNSSETLGFSNQTIEGSDPLEITGAVIFPVTETNGPNNGAIDISVTGGTEPYTYFWEQNSAISQDLINIPVFSYNVIVTDANGCSVTSPLYQVGLFNVIDEDVTDVACANAGDGTICVTVNPDVAGTFSYAWSNGGTSNCINNLIAGNYNVTITNVESGVSIVEGPFTLEAQSNLNVVAAATTTFVGGFNVSCNGENDATAQAASTGGVGAVNYLWSNSTVGQNTANLAAGDYNVIATDALGCMDTAFVNITEPAPFAIDYDKTLPGCDGNFNGSIRVMPTGGAAVNTQGYFYTWQGENADGQDGQTATLLGVGTYAVTVEDHNGCIATGSTFLPEPNPLEVTFDITGDDGSGNGSATAHVTGGTPDYMYQWTTAGGLDRDSTLADQFAGNFIIIITDAGGCSEMFEITIPDESVECLEYRVVITPNSGNQTGLVDDMNEFFIINCLDRYPDNTLFIFNRWGQLIFETEGYQNDWNGITNRGIDVPEGGYFFVFEYTDVDGTREQRKGSITVLR